MKRYEGQKNPVIICSDREHKSAIYKALRPHFKINVATAFPNIDVFSTFPTKVRNGDSKALKDVGIVVMDASDINTQYAYKARETVLQIRAGKFEKAGIPQSIPILYLGPSNTFNHISGVSNGKNSDEVDVPCKVGISDSAYQPILDTARMCSIDGEIPSESTMLNRFKINRTHVRCRLYSGDEHTSDIGVPVVVRNIGDFSSLTHNRDHNGGSRHDRSRERYLMERILDIDVAAACGQISKQRVALG